MASAVGSREVIVLAYRPWSALAAGASSSAGTQAKPYIAERPHAQVGGGGIARRTERRTVSDGTAALTLVTKARSVASLSAQTSIEDGRMMPRLHTRSVDRFSIGQRVGAARRQRAAGTTVVWIRPAR